MFFFFILWLARHHLYLIARSLLGRPAATNQVWHGLIDPRLGVLLFAGSFIGIVVWLRLFGVDLLTAILFMGVCWMLQLVSSRLVCQGGLPYFTLTAAPSDGFLAFIDTRILAPTALYLSLIVQKISFLDMRESLLPSAFHASRLADGSQTLIQFWEKHPDSRMALQRWFKIVQKTEFHSFAELRQVFPSADKLDHWVIFNIGDNKYRLIASIHFNRGKV